MTPKEYDSMTEEERTAYDATARKKEAEEQATLPFKWRQTLVDVDISFEVPKGTRGKDLVIEIKKKSLRAGLRGQTPIIEGTLTKEVRLDDSTWSLEDQKEVAIHLEKAKGSEWWKSVIEGHPEIDTTKIVPENSKLGDLDGETRGMVEKMMFDQRQKAAGLPSSDDLKKAEAFKKFKAMHPEMDFSNANMG